VRSRAKHVLLILVVEYCLTLTGFAQEPTIPYCGSGNAEPYAAKSDGKNRPCDPNGQRHYVPRHKGIGFDILDSESQACFVSDQEYRLLDDLIDMILKKVKYDASSTSSWTKRGLSARPSAPLCLKKDLHSISIQRR